MRAATLGLAVVIVQLALPQSALAQSAARHNSSRGSSTTKRVVWSLIGAGAGFGLGAMFGLHKFDDATHSDRKVTLSAITGAVIGGFAGGVLSGDVKPSSWPKRPRTVEGRIAFPKFGTERDRALRARVAAANQRAFLSTAASR
jgi:hypothetical protein